MNCAAFIDQDYDRVMSRYPIIAGDTVYVPGGIIHAFGPGTLIFEVQQTCDLGQSVMPTDLYGHRLSDEQWRANIDATLAELKTDFLPRPHPGWTSPKRAGEPHHRRLRRPLLRARALAADRAAPDPAHPALPDPLQRRRAGHHRLERRRRGLGRAESVLLPAAIGDVRVSPSGAEADLIACYLPDLERDVVGPLRSAGHSEEAIPALGEVAF